MSLLIEAFSLPLLQRALLAGLLVSIACGIVGTYVVLKRISSITGGLSHSAFGGVGLGYFCGFSPLAGALGFCMACAVLLTIVYRKRREGLDTLVSMLWSLGMALGMLFIALTPGYAPDLSGYLFGSILFVPNEYLLLCFALDVLILLTVILFSKYFQAVCFDEEYAETAGLSVDFILLCLLLLTALTVVFLIKVAGVILSIALLTTPAVVARHWQSSLSSIMLFAVLLSAFGIAAGLFITYGLSAAWEVETPTGPLIIICLTFVYVVSLALRWLGTRGELE